ncbi:MAG: hypothetical protein ABI595_05410 [Actinomycetota bacterium]
MRTLSSIRRAATVPTLAFMLVVAAAQAAHACSCAPGDPRDALHGADGAFVGTLVERTEVDDQTSIFTFEVETAVKGALGVEVDVRSASNGAACGLEVGFGQRIGLFLDTANDGAWTSGLCSQIDPEVLLEAAQPLPPPDGVGPVRYVVGGNLGENRLMALDRKGRTLGYGAGDGYAQDVQVCPGATRVLESAAVGRKAQLVLRELPALEVVRTITLAETRRPWLPHAACLSGNGGRLLAFERHKAEYWLHQVTGSTDRIAWHGHVRDVVIRDGHAYVIDGLELFEMNVRDGSLRPLAPVPAHVQRVAVSPDGSRIAGFVFGRSDPVPTPSRVVSVRVADGALTSFELTDFAFGDVAWVDAGTIAYLPGGSDDQHAWLLDAVTMRPVGGFDGWYAAESVVLGGAVFGIGWGQLARADLGGGDVRLVRAFDGPQTFVLDVVPSMGTSA